LFTSGFVDDVMFSTMALLRRDTIAAVSLQCRPRANAPAVCVLS